MLERRHSKNTIYFIGDLFSKNKGKTREHLGTAAQQKHNYRRECKCVSSKDQGQAIGDALVPAGAGRASVVVRCAVEAAVEAATVGRAGEAAGQRRAPPGCGTQRGQVRSGQPAAALQQNRREGEQAERRLPPEQYTRKRMGHRDKRYCR